MLWNGVYGSIVAPVLDGLPEIQVNLDPCVQIVAHVGVYCLDLGGLLGYSVGRHYDSSYVIGIKLAVKSRVAN